MASEHGSERCGGSRVRSSWWDDPRGPEFNNSPDSTAGGTAMSCGGCPDCEPVPLPEPVSGEETWTINVCPECGAHKPIGTCGCTRPKDDTTPEPIEVVPASRLSLAEKRAEEAEARVRELTGDDEDEWTPTFERVTPKQIKALDELLAIKAVEGESPMTLDDEADQAEQTELANALARAESLATENERLKGALERIGGTTWRGHQCPGSACVDPVCIARSTLSALSNSGEL